MLIVKPILIDTRKKKQTTAEAFLLFFTICILSGIVD